MTDYALVPHPDMPPRSVDFVTVAVSRAGDRLELRYEVGGAAADLALPSPANSDRSDGLWRTTCFELFLATGLGAYLELNFAPSSQWAAYSFTGYRAGMELPEVDNPPAIGVSGDGYARLVTVAINLPHAATGAVGLSAVIEETDGTKSYWALAHAPGVPDFHNPDCFIAALPAPDRS